jgi:hypothetical protein
MTILRHTTSDCFWHRDCLSDGMTGESPTIRHPAFALLRAAKARAAALGRQIRHALTDFTYRPEVHYMRGPGPKSRQKLAGAAH